MGLLTLEYIKSYLGIKTSETDDPFLQHIVNGINADANSYCKQTLETTLYNKRYDGTGNNELLLDETRVTAINSVKYGYDEAGLVTIDATTYLWFEDGFIQFINGQVFTKLRRYWKINYNAGYATPPAELLLALAEMGAFIYHRKKDQRIGLASLTAGPEVSTSFLQEYPKDVLSRLDRYVKKDVFG